MHPQIYHHCAIGQRYDFLCPNYTLFDQTTFTCRFINTVDCSGSAKHFDRNNALYVEKDDSGKGAEHAASSTSSSTSASGSSSTTSTTSTTTSTTSTTQAPRVRAPSSRQSGERAPLSATELLMQHQQARIAAGSQTALLASRLAAGSNGDQSGRQARSEGA